MSWIQTMVTKLLPRSWSAAVEAESRAWVMVCPCGHVTTSVWDAGGIRYKAAGNPFRPAVCPECGPTIHQLYKRTPPAGPQS